MQRHETFVSVVVPFYNRRNLVRPCIESILNQRETCRFDFEVIAVDNGSTDGTREELSRWPVRIADAKRRGPAAARNEGIRESQSPVIAFTDSDCIASKHWLRRLVQPLIGDHSLTAVGGRIRALRLDTGISWYQEAAGILNQRKFFRGGPLFPPFLATANCAWRRDRIVGVDGFDEDLQVGEDADLSWRILESGGVLAYAPNAVVRHDHRRSFAGLYRQAEAYGKSVPILLRKHRKRLPSHRHVPWDAWIALGRQPFETLERVTKKSGAELLWPLYESVWQTGYAWGRLKESIGSRRFDCF